MTHQTYQQIHQYTRQYTNALPVTTPELTTINPYYHHRPIDRPNERTSDNQPSTTCHLPDCPARFNPSRSSTSSPLPSHPQPSILLSTYCVFPSSLFPIVLNLRCFRVGARRFNLIDTCIGAVVLDNSTSGCRSPKIRDGDVPSGSGSGSSNGSGRIRIRSSTAFSYPTPITHSLPLPFIRWRYHHHDLKRRKRPHDHPIIYDHSRSL